MPADQDGRAGWKRCRYVNRFIPFLQWPFFRLPTDDLPHSASFKSLSNCVAIDPEKTATLAVFAARHSADRQGPSIR